MSKYEQLHDGEGVEMPANEKFRFACCDCGLVHDMVVVPARGGKKFGFAVRRNRRATTLRRRSLEKKRANAVPLVNADLGAASAGK